MVSGCFAPLEGGMTIATGIGMEVVAGVRTVGEAVTVEGGTGEGVGDVTAAAAAAAEVERDITVPPANLIFTPFGARMDGRVLLLSLFRADGFLTQRCS